MCRGNRDIDHTTHATNREKDEEKKNPANQRSEKTSGLHKIPGRDLIKAITAEAICLVGGAGVRVGRGRRHTHAMQYELVHFTQPQQVTQTSKE